MRWLSELEYDRQINCRTPARERGEVHRGMKNGADSPNIEKKGDVHDPGNIEVLRC